MKDRQEADPERDKVSAQEVAIFQTVREGSWLTVRDVSERAKVANATARLHLLKFQRLGLVEAAQVFPGRRYRWTGAKAAKLNAGYIARLAKAAAVLGKAARAG